MPAEKDDYDRAWEQRQATDRARARSARLTGSAIRWTGAILFALGLSLAAVGAEGLAVYNACVANALCFVSLSGDGWEGFLAVEIVGILFVLVGVWTAVLRPLLARARRHPG